MNFKQPLPIDDLPDSKLLTTTEVAEYLNVELRFVRNILLTGALRGFRIGKRKWRVRTDDLQRYVSDAIDTEQRKVKFNG